MSTSRSLVLAGLLGGLALLGTGVAQAQNGPAVPVCTQTEHGYTCFEHVERTYSTRDGEVRTESTVSCSAESRAPKAQQYAEERHGTVMECSGSAFR